MRILKALIRRVYWVVQHILLRFGVSVLFLDPVDFRNFRISRITPKEEIWEFLEKFRPIDNGFSLIRVGGGGDGGYLVPDDLDKIQVCFSAGCDLNWSFEKNLGDTYNIHSHIIDSADKKPLDLGPLQTFTSSWLGISSIGSVVSFQDWISESGVTNDDNLLLQMDIEGFEWECINGIDQNLLNQFAIVVIEFHGIQNCLNYKLFSELHSPVISKLLDCFDLVHFHPNNCCGSANFKGDIKFPNVFEVTFHRKDRAKGYFGYRKIPNNLDRKNVISKEDLLVSFNQKQNGVEES